MPVRLRPLQCPSLPVTQRRRRQAPALCLGLASEGDAVLVLHGEARTPALAAPGGGFRSVTHPLPLALCYSPSASLFPSVKWGVCTTVPHHSGE